MVSETQRPRQYGVEIDCCGAAINAFLEIETPAVCSLAVERARLEGMNEASRRVIRDYVSHPGTTWYKFRAGSIPTKIRLQDFKPIARAWGEFWVKNVEPVGNSLEYQVDNAIAVKLIMEQRDINIGEAISHSLHKMATTESKTFTLGHCNFITALCKHHLVPSYTSDKLLPPIRPLSERAFRTFEVGLVRGRGDVDMKLDDEEEEIDRYEGGVHPDQEQVPSNRHSVNEAAYLLTQLDLCAVNQLPHMYFDTQSSLYTEAMAHRAQFDKPQPFYPMYPAREDFLKKQNEDLEHYMAIQTRNLRVYDEQVRAYHHRENEERQRFFATEDELFGASASTMPGFQNPDDLTA